MQWWDSEVGNLETSTVVWIPEEAKAQCLESLLVDLAAWERK